MPKSCIMFCPTNTWGGVEKNVRLRAKALGEQGYKVVVVLLRKKFAEKFQGLKNVVVISVNQRGGDINMLVVKRYCQIIKQHQPKVVFSALKKDWFLVSLAAYLCYVPRIILYLGIQRKIRNGFKYRLVFNTFKAKVLINSNSLKKDLVASNAFFSTANVFRIYNGFDIPSETVTALDIKNMFNLSSDVFIIGGAGRFSQQKGFDLIPKILAQLPENVHFVHAGGNGEPHEIQQTLAASEVSDRIHFVGYQDNIIPFLKGINVFLLSSRWEGMANVLNEAMSVGTAVISTRVAGSEELLQNGRYGQLCPTEDVDCMAKAILKVYEQTIEHHPQQLIERIRKSFSKQQMISQTQHLFFGNLQTFKETP